MREIVGRGRGAVKQGKSLMGNAMVDDVDKVDGLNRAFYLNFSSTLSTLSTSSILSTPSTTLDSPIPCIPATTLLKSRWCKHRAAPEP